MHDISHAIIRLAVHLPDEQAVYFQPGGEQVALEAASSKEITLTAWFKIIQQDPSEINIFIRKFQKTLCLTKHPIHGNQE
jgi:hypothetical protein